MKDRLRIIHLEDNPHDRELVQNLLESDGIVCDFRYEETRDGFRTALEDGTWDLIISDFTLPGYDGLSALTFAQDTHPDIPYLFVSGTMGEEQAVESLKHGATDYVLKHRLDRLVPAVRRALLESENWTQRKKADLLREAFFELGQQLNSATNPQTAARIILDVAQRLLGWDAGSFDLFSAEQSTIRPVLTMEMVLGRKIDVPRVATLRPLTPQVLLCIEQGGRLILSNEPEIDPSVPSSGSAPPLAPSALLVPVRNGAKTVGVLQIEKFTPPDYTDDDLMTLLVLADHCGGALERIAIQEDKDRLLAELQRQQRRLDNILAGIPAIVWEVWKAPDPENLDTNFVSRHVESMLGYSVEEWMSIPDLWLRIVHPEDKQRVYQEIEQMLSLGKGMTHQYRWIAKSKRVVWVETSAIIICRDDGTPFGFRGVTIDISEKRAVEAVEMT